MNEIVYSTITIIFATISYCIAWRYFLRNNTKFAVYYLIIGGLILRIYTSSDNYLHEWDERYHSLVAKNLIKHPLKPTLYEKPVLPYDYKDWTSNHIWIHKPPLPLWAMAISMSIFGINEFAIRIPSIILSSLSILILLGIGRYFYNDRIAFLACYFFSINGLIIELTAGRVATDHIDIFLMFFIELAILFSILFVQTQKSIFNVLAGMSTAAAILSKWLVALIVIPIWILILLDSNKFSPKKIIKHFLVLVSTCLALSLPWQIYIYTAFSNEAKWETSFNFKHFTEVLENQTGSIFYYVNKIRINYGELIYLAIIYFLYKLKASHYDKKRLALLVWFLLPIIIFSFAKTKMQAYIVFVSPALFLITSEFYFYINESEHHFKYLWLPKIILFLIIILPIRYMIERTKLFSNENRHPQWVRSLKKLNNEVSQNTIIFNYDRPIEAMFYTNVIVYSQIPDTTKLKELNQQGYEIILIEKPDLPEYYRKIKIIKTLTIE